MVKLTLKRTIGGGCSSSETAASSTVAEPDAKWSGVAYCSCGAQFLYGHWDRDLVKDHLKTHGIFVNDDLLVKFETIGEMVIPI